MRYGALFLISLAGCAQFPALDGTITDAAHNAPYPRLTQLPDSFETARTDDAEADLTARLAALQARAERLRQFEIGALQ